MNLRNVLFLNNEEQELLFKYEDERFLYQSTKVAHNCSQNIQNSKIMQFFFRCVLFVAMTTRHMILQSILFLNYNIQGSLFMYDDKRYLYQSTIVDKN